MRPVCPLQVREKPVRVREKEDDDDNLAVVVVVIFFSVLTPCRYVLSTYSRVWTTWSVVVHQA